MGTIETDQLSAINVTLTDSKTPVGVNGIRLDNGKLFEYDSSVVCFEDLDDTARENVIERVSSTMEETEGRVAHYSRNLLVRKREIAAGALILAATAIGDFMMVQTGYGWPSWGYGGYVPEVLSGIAGYFFGGGWLADGVFNIGHTREELQKNSDAHFELNAVKTIAMGWTALSDSRSAEQTDFKTVSLKEIQSWSDVEGQLQALRETA